MEAAGRRLWRLYQDEHITARRWRMLEGSAGLKCPSKQMVVFVSFPRPEPVMGRSRWKDSGWSYSTTPSGRPSARGTLGCSTLGVCVAEPARQKKSHPDGPGVVNPKAEVELQGGRCGLGCACKTIS